MAKQTRGKSSSFSCKPGKRSRQADTETHPRVIDINRFSQRKHPSRIPTCHNPLIQARNQAVAAHGPEEAIAAEGMLTGAMGKLFALMENYPDLKANENVSRLMEELSATENKISFSRQFYNDSVMSLNNAVQEFPSNIVAGMFRFTTATYFEVPETETATPRVDLR